MNWYGLPMETWTRYTTRLMHHNVDEDQVRKLMKMEEYFEMIVFLSRLAHTPPEVLFPQLENRGDYTKAYDLPIAWRGVTSVYGPRYPHIPPAMFRLLLSGRTMMKAASIPTKDTASSKARMLATNL